MPQAAAIAMLVVAAVARAPTGEIAMAQGWLDAAVVGPVREGPYIRMLPRGGAERLGVAVYEVTPQLAEYSGTNGGVLIASVRHWSPADRAGLRAGDVITKVDGRAVRTTADLRRMLQRDLTNVELSISVTRDRRNQTIKIKVRS